MMHKWLFIFLALSCFSPVSLQANTQDQIELEQPRKTFSEKKVEQPPHMNAAVKMVQQPTLNHQIKAVPQAIPTQPIKAVVQRLPHNQPIKEVQQSVPKDPFKMIRQLIPKQLIKTVQPNKSNQAMRSDRANDANQAIKVEQLNAIQANKVLTTKTNIATDKIRNFLEQEINKISSNFPYRINLYKKGQIDKNQAGMRIVERSKQLFANDSSLLFFYQLYNHSMQVPHWHANATEIGSVLSGKMRVTIWQGSGEAKVFTVEKNGTWMIPQATLHSIENMGQGPLIFLVAYNAPNTADLEFATACASLPDAIIERTLGLTAEEVESLKKSTPNRLCNYDKAACSEKVTASSPYSGNFATVRSLHSSHYGSIKRIDETTNPLLQTMALQQTILKPGSLRVPHWYTACDTLLFVYKGDAFFTLVDNEARVYNAIIRPGDLIFIPVGAFHSYLNISKTDLEIYEAFNSAKGLSEITLLNGAKHCSAGSLVGATGLNKTSAQKIINNQSQDYIIPF